MHKKRVSGKHYFYTTIRKGNKTESVYLGRDYNVALKKEKGLKNSDSNKHVFDLIVLIGVLVAFAFLLRLSFTGYSVQDISEQVVTGDSGVVPNINVKEKDGKIGVYKLDKRGDRFDLDAEVGDNKIKIRGLRTTKDVDIIFGKDEELNADFIYADIDEIEEAEIRLRHDRIGGITTGKAPVFVCDDFNLTNLECGNWSYAGIDAYDRGDYYIFNVSHFTTYRVGESQNYTDISQCLFYVNGTTDYCRLNDANITYNMSGSQTWLSDANLYNKTGMVAGFNFSDTGNYTALDLSGYGWNGTIYGSPLNASRLFSTNSSALDFDGKNDYVGVAYNSIFNTSTYTVSAWFNPRANNVGAWKGIFVKGDNNFRSFFLGTDNSNPNRLECFFDAVGGGADKFCESTSTFVAGKWSHGTCMFNGSAMFVYFNGNLEKTCNQGTIPTSDTGKLRIGQQNDVNYFNGTIDEAVFYNRTLTADEIAKLTWGHYNNYEMYGGGTGGTSAIEMIESNITLDCAGKTLKGNGTGVGINVATDGTSHYDRQNHTILNCNLDWFNRGITTRSRTTIIKNITVKDTIAEGIFLSVNTVDGIYVNYLEKINIVNSSTEEGMQANAGGLTNITIINMNSSFNKKQNLIVNSDYYKIINSYFYNSTSDHCVQLGGNDVTESLFVNNTMKYCYTDNKIGLVISNVGPSRLIVENNTMEENNINLATTTVTNLTIRNNVMNTSYELDYVSGIGSNVLLLGLTQNITFINNSIYNSAENGITMGNEGAGVLNTLNFTNNSIYNTSASWDFYIATSDTYNVSAWLNNFYSKGVNNGSVEISKPNFCVSDEGNFYEENIGNYTNKTYKGWNDCGQSNFTTPKAGDTIDGDYNITWRKQSSFNNINYTIQIRNPSEVWSNITTTSLLSYLLNTKDYSNGNYLLRIIPDDGYKRATNYSLTSTIKIDNLAAVTAAAVGGGSSSAGAPRTYTTVFKVDKQQIKTMLSSQEIKTETFTIRNEVPNSISMSIDVDEKLKNLIELSEKMFYLGPKESKMVNIIIKAYRDAGIYIGNIILSSGDTVKKIPLIIDVQSRERQIDAELYIAPEYGKVNPGGEIVAKVNLFDIGDKVRIEAIVRYIIKSVDGDDIKQEEENIVLEKQLSFNKAISLPKDIQPGTYVLGIEVMHSNFISTSSEIFEVVAEEVKKELQIKDSILFIIFSIALIIILIGIVKLIKRKL